MTVHKHNPEIRRINKEMRARKDLHWRVIDKAIKQATRIRQMTGDDGDYQQLLENLISDIVNLRV